MTDKIIELLKYYEIDIDKSLEYPDGKFDFCEDIGNISVLEHQQGKRDDLCVRIFRIKKSEKKRRE